MRPAVEGDDTEFTALLGLDQNIRRILRDEDAAVVFGGNHGRSAGLTQAARILPQVPGVVGVHNGSSVVIVNDVWETACRTHSGSQSSLGFRRQRRNFAVRRVDHKRGSWIRLDSVLPRAQSVSGGIVVDRIRIE